MDGPADPATPMSESALREYLERPMEKPAPDVLDAIERGPIDPADALKRDDVERLLRPRAARSRDGLVHATRRCRLRGRPHRDAGRDRGDGGLVV